MERNRIYWIIGALAILSLFVPFYWTPFTLIGLMALFFIPGWMLLGKEKSLERVIAAVVVSMSLVALLYYAFYYLVTPWTPPFIILLILVEAALIWKRN